ncbi:acyltransferase family protein [Rivibacter subsaxonicus]|uniref:Peptidoglycan/LPS O-acetylase OafA/YrhL n=1 Tax=Rivibacter subsaxonicus TaxID=457575 RepID=A0A4Q7VP83_9BURK|nr:acyltransferase family protein [Rivibacter subsaxonicus]RZT98210.1 peptidoglycan/LPS O-acetylase OafA/YrhL [Rivibacter subsaxonicus]
MSLPASRLLHVDLLKAVASQLIVLHHLAFYGPMSDHAALLAPALFGWLAQHGRLAVQVFLVLGGFLAARQLAPLMQLRPNQHRLRPVLEQLRRRYLRLVLPLASMLVLALLAAAVARRWMEHDSIPAAPSLPQVLAHLALLQDVLDIEALSAGVWYVAIDFQLFALLLLLLAVAAGIGKRLRLREPLAPWFVAALVAASLLRFNRDADWDVAAPYFFGSYGLGVLSAWWLAAGRPRVPALAMALLVLVALGLEWRTRIALAVSVALFVALVEGRMDWLRGSAAQATRWLAGISYAVFLVHFPICLLVNAAFDAFVPAEPALQAAGIGLAWALSVLAGALFHRWVERPAGRWLAAPRTVPDAATIRA